MAFNVSSASFLAITVIEGEGRVGDVKVSRGDTVFRPAGVGEIAIEALGELGFITVRVPDCK